MTSGAGSGTCPGCGAPHSAVAGFCGKCGRALGPAHPGASVRGREGNAVAAIAIVFVGTLLSLAASGFLVRLELPGGVIAPLFSALLLAVGVAASWVLLREGWRMTFGAPASASTILVGAAAGAASFGLTLLVVGLLGRLFGRTAPPESTWQPLNLLVVAAIPACVEEWLCRGVLWTALREVSDTVGTIVLSAALFSLMHVLNGAFVLELPHRLVAGLVFGLVRWKTGSLGPAVAAHFVHNVLAVVLLGE